MDEFGVLVESIGFRARGRSAPMAKLNPKPKSHFTPNSNASSFSDSFDGLDGIFASGLNINKTQNFFASAAAADIFGGSSNEYGGIHFDSVLNSSNNSNFNSLASNAYDDLLGLNSKHSDPVVDDVFGSFVSASSGKQEKKGSGLEDFIPGFGRSSPIPTNKGESTRTNLFPELNVQKDDPFLVFESSVAEFETSWPFVGPSGQDTGKGSAPISLDELENFAMGHTDSRTNRIRNNTNKPSAAGTTSNGFENANDLDTIFGSSVQQRHAAKSTSTTQDNKLDFFFREEKRPEVEQTTSWSSISKQKAFTVTSIPDDFTSLFGDAAASSQKFHEIEGEPAERRRARLNRHIRTNARMAEALAEKNQRDHQSHIEQEEKRRLAETLDNDIKRWAAGKEGNLRALLSSLQQILWPECGWRAVSLTDMITSDSVKKVYKKATLYVHPDKVQQKGANLRQKYIAEKVFDLLKEAWNKFSAEELR